MDEAVRLSSSLPELISGLLVQALVPTDHSDIESFGLGLSRSLSFHHENNTDEESLSDYTRLLELCGRPSLGLDHVSDHIAFLQRQTLGPASGQRNLAGYSSPDAQDFSCDRDFLNE